MDELRCIKCCRRVYADEVITYYPDETTQEFICLKCWSKMTDEERKIEEENNLIPPHEIVI
jgi:hypothetical protein